MSAILLFGVSGQLGYRLNEALTAAGHEVTALDRAACDFATVDTKQLEMKLRAVEPEIIINAAAYTAVDKAENEPELAQRINAEMPALIAKNAKGTKFLHFSTDYVFDGVRGRYHEDAATNPVNIYGASKLAGERAVLEEGGHVFRLQWVYDSRGKNFLLTMKTLLAEKESLDVVADQVGAPSSARALAEAITAAVPKIIAGDIAPGIYHLTAAGYTSWHGFACAIAAAIGSKTRIRPIPSAEYPTPATRPLDGRLFSTKLAAHGITLPHWRDSLNTLLND